MSKIAVCGGALMAASAFVTPAGPRTARMQSSLRGTNVEQGKAKSGTSLSGALASMAGLAAVANRPARTPQTVLCAYDASNEIGACDPLLFWDPIGYCGGDCTKQD
eukprot:g7013.t1